jgi:hypothetical protein
LFNFCAGQAKTCPTFFCEGLSYFTQPTPNQTMNFLAAEIDLGVTGY